MKRLPFLVAVGLFLSATQAFAASQEFNDLLYFEGVWECEGKAMDATGNSTQDVSSIVTATSMMDASWLQLTIFEARNDAAVHIATRMLGYDATWKRYVSYESGREGAWSFLSTADSMTSRMDWSGYLHNFQGHLARHLEESVRRVSEDAFTWVSKVKDASGTWQTLYDGSCHRQAN